MFTRAEKGYLALALGLLAAGSGLKAWRLSGMRIGPFQDPSFAAVKTAKSVQLVMDSSDRSSPAIAAFEPVEARSAADSAMDSPLAVNDPSNREVEVAKRPRNPADSIPQAPKHGRSGQPPKPKSSFTGKVDLNRAAAAELTQVKGIGEKTALAIIEYRATHGPFRELRDLLQVKGIGEKKLEKLEPFLIL